MGFHRDHLFTIYANDSKGKLGYRFADDTKLGIKMNPEKVAKAEQMGKKIAGTICRRDV